MAADFIGVIVGAVSGQIYSVINPDDDAELDNPRFLLLKGSELEPMLLVRMRRDSYMACLSMDEVAAIVARLVNHQ